MKEKLKTRSTYYQRHMNDEVKVKISRISKETGLAQWLIVEKILETSLGISNDNTVDVSKWLGLNHSKSRTGKRQGK